MNSYNMICENCGCEHDGTFGSGRFCSISCQITFSNKHRKLSEITKEKISASVHKLAKDRSCKVCGKKFKRGDGYKTSKVFCSEECHSKYIKNRTYYILYTNSKE